uniref:rRNA-processing protein EFG1 n=1 Tax=Odontella aurita TaxID=265563 RepID=A0A6U6GW67_9STRA|mmetsp:Transcript_43801/g.133305  ORF Transcript_43801/g.133305 Transcript_43801/m.133305 type:complete len:312 (+) Transcript_43801:304-1239(+)
MPRPPTRHGLEKKYKSWRRGKSTSTAAKKGGPTAAAAAGGGAGGGGGGGGGGKGSLKNQLRSQRRFLSKLPPPPPDGDENDDAAADAAAAKALATRKAIESRIAEIERLISTRDRIEFERKNAAKYHRVRFFDRQKLTRLERKLRRERDDALADGDGAVARRREAEWRRCALDQLYVAHFPHGERYLPLFGGGEAAGKNKRTGDGGKDGRKKKVIAERLWRDYTEGKIAPKEWVNRGALDRVRESDIRRMDDADSGEGPKERPREGLQDARFGGAAGAPSMSERTPPPEPELPSKKRRKDERGSDDKGAGD